MIGRRFGPLIVLVGLGAAFVLIRAGRIQVTEHETWAREAANLERSSRRLPYHRGKILARGGEVLVEDEEQYLVSFEWRAFRRENPIGQVALASSAWTGAAVELLSDPDDLAARALELLELSPADLAVLAGTDRARAGDMAFYLRRLTALSERADGRLRQLMAEREETRSVLSLAAQACSEVRSELRGEDAIREHVRARCWASLYDLDQLELSLGRERGALLEELTRRGHEVEDGVASRMFRRAAGIPAGRLEPEALAAWDLNWLQRALRWSDERLRQWHAATRRGWQEYMLTRIAPSAALEARLSAEESTIDALLWMLAPSVATSEGSQRAALLPWGEALSGATPPALFAGTALSSAKGALPSFLALSKNDQEGAWSPTQDLFLHGGQALELGGWGPLWDAVGLSDWQPPASAYEAFTRWESESSAEDRRLAQWLLVRWAREWERGWLVHQAPDPDGPLLSLTEDRVEAALDDQDYFLVEQGRRVRALERSPSYEVVYLLSRYPERFKGFQVETQTQRTSNEGALSEGDPLWRVIGDARRTNLREILVHRGGFEELRSLRQQALRSENDEFELRQLVESLPRYDELHGADGVERLMDEDLTGRNGYLEYESLAELVRRGGAPVLDWRPEHGSDVELTIDLELQRAASETINFPEPTGDTRFQDEEWFSTPTGAICLLNPAGEVLAAASAPRLGGRSPIPFRDGQGAFAYERTLRRYTALPVGSVFKPFAALWCLEQGQLSEDEGLACVHRERRGARFPGYRSVDCHSSRGHGRLNLTAALRVSCNAYFAQLGDRLGTGAALVECAHTFGFDMPTGVNARAEGQAIPEDYESPSFRRADSFTDVELQRGANGLMVLEGTPLQVARAYAGIATGTLPELSFVRDGAAEGAPLPISADHLAVVQGALKEVARTGSAKLLKGLDVAVKTGSADYAKMTPEVAAQLKFPAGSEPARRKHTWVAGWTPADDPELIFVVYLHDVGVTSSHSAVFVARQLLSRPEVRAHLEGDGS